MPPSPTTNRRNNRRIPEALRSSPLPPTSLVHNAQPHPRSSSTAQRMEPRKNNPHLEILHSHPSKSRPKSHRRILATRILRSHSTRRRRPGKDSPLRLRKPQKSQPK